MLHSRRRIVLNDRLGNFEHPVKKNCVNIFGWCYCIDLLVERYSSICQGSITDRCKASGNASQKNGVSFYNTPLFQPLLREHLSTFGYIHFSINDIVGFDLLDKVTIV